MDVCRGGFTLFWVWILLHGLTQLGTADKCLDIPGCTNNADCSSFRCAVRFLKEDVALEIKLNKCQEPVTVTVQVDVEHLDIQLSHTFASTDEVSIPGLTYDATIARVGVYLRADIEEEDNNVFLKLKLYPKLSLGSKSVGEQLTVTVVNGKVGELNRGSCGIKNWFNRQSAGVKAAVIVTAIAVPLIIVVVAIVCFCRRKRPGSRPNVRRRAGKVGVASKSFPMKKQDRKPFRTR